MTHSDNRPVAPGEHLGHTLREQGISNAQLAEQLGRSAQYVTDIIKGKKAMDVDLAIELGTVLNKMGVEGALSATQWMEMEIKHRQSISKFTRAGILDSYPFAKELVKLKWVDGTLPLDDLDKQLRAFWSLKGKAANFRESPKLKVNEDARRAWAIQVYIKANEQQGVGKYSEDSINALILRLRKIRKSPNDVAKLPELLKKHGIRFVFLQNPKQCPVDGVASMNVDENGRPSPYIGMSLRIARLDSFWFTLLHELAHIRNGDSNVEPDNIDVPTDTDAIEHRANLWAMNELLRVEDYDNFVDEGDFSFKAIEREAGKYGLHPSILIGRLKRDLILDWSQFAREHPGVREIIAAAAS